MCSDSLADRKNFKCFYISSVENCLFKNVYLWCKNGIGRELLHPYFTLAAVYVSVSLTLGKKRT